jgi:hypothetical protein
LIYLDQYHFFFIFGVLNYELFGLNGLVLAQFKDIPRSESYKTYLKQVLLNIF